MSVPIFNTGFDPRNEVFKIPNLVPLGRSIPRRVSGEQPSEYNLLGGFFSEYRSLWIGKVFLELQVLAAEAIDLRLSAPGKRVTHHKVH